MKRIQLLCALTSLTSIVATVGVAHGEPVVVEREALRQRLSQLGERMKNLNAAVNDLQVAPEWLKWLQTELAAERALVEDSLRLVNSAPPAGPQGILVAPPPPPPRGRPPVLDEQRLAEVVGAIHDESFSTGKLRVIEEIARTSWFRVSQVDQMLSELSFDNDKLRALELLAPHIVDRQDGYRLFKQFPFEASKQRAQRILDGAR